MNKNPSEAGFTLLEAVVSALLLAALASGVLYSLAFTLQTGRRSEAAWEAALERWNRSRRIRNAADSSGRPWQPLPDCRPLYRISVVSDLDGRLARWEVLRAEK